MATLAAKTTGKVAQYLLSGENNAAVIGPYDSGTILGTVPPGKPGIKQIDGTVQNATALTVTPVGTDSQNFLACTTQPTALGDPIVNPAQLASAGLSLAPQHE